MLNAPYDYNNRLLDAVAERHLISRKMLLYIYKSDDFTNEEIWSKGGAMRWNILLMN